MGNVNISIRLVGCHHNRSLPTDANRMAAEFVQKLRDANHSVLSATVTYGGEDNIADPVQYLDDRDAIEGVAEDRRRPRCAKAVATPTDSVECRLAHGHLGVCLPPIHWSAL